MNFQDLLPVLLSFGITAVATPLLIPVLKRLKAGQTERKEGVKAHLAKAGTPTMGGIAILLGILVPGLIYLPGHPSVLPVLILTVGFGLIGFLDDFLKVVLRRSDGLFPKQKLALQFFVAIAYLAVMYLFGDDSKTWIPFVGMVDIGLLYYPIAAVLIVGIVNAVNLTDGIDGLDGSVTFFAGIFLMLMAGYTSRIGLSIMSAALSGGCLGFLLWNFNPAKTFMGDTGSLYLGGYLCALLFGLDMEILLVPVGLIYICEMFSVILQVTYFKLTHGKRLFKMSPIHHHFEMCGWSEVKIVIVFSFVESIACAGALALVILGR